MNQPAPVTENIASEQAERLCALREMLPELDRRYTRLCALLNEACTRDVPMHRIQLAIGDVQSAIAACGFEQPTPDDGEDPDWG